MNLKQITAVLLPTESRETILGDLEERGLRSGDIASVLIAAWASYFHREWLGPVPNLANASSEALTARTQQLLRSRQAAILFYTGAYASVVIVKHLQLPLNPLIALLPRLNHRSCKRCLLDRPTRSIATAQPSRPLRLHF